jgi:hypothetical protein
MAVDVLGDKRGNVITRLNASSTQDVAKTVSGLRLDFDSRATRWVDENLELVIAISLFFDNAHDAIS